MLNRPDSKLRVAWLCHYPTYKLANSKTLYQPEIHATPWITVQAPLLAATPGIELHIVTVGKKFRSDEHFVENKMHFHFLKVPAIPRALMLYQIDKLRIHQALKEINPHVVHSFGTESSYSYAAVTSDYPVVVRLQGIYSQILRTSGLRILLRHPGWLLPIMLESYTLKRCRNFIAPSHFGAEFIRRHNLTGSIYSLKTPVHPVFFQVRRNGAHGAPPPEILFVGRVVREKGIEILLPAFADLAREYPAAKLHLVGPCDDDYMVMTLNPLLKHLDIADRVLFRGFKSEVEIADLHSRVAALVLPTLMDTSPNVVTEAQVAGVPVVASAVGGIPEMIKHGISGILVESGSIESLTQGLLLILRNPGLAANLAAKARGQALIDYQPEKQVEKLAAIYYRIVA